MAKGDDGNWPSSLDATLAAMDEAGVDVSLISAWHGPQGSLISNDEVAACIDQAPRRFAGLATVDLSNPVKAVAELRRVAPRQVALMAPTKLMTSMPVNSVAQLPSQRRTGRENV